MSTFVFILLGKIRRSLGSIKKVFPYVLRLEGSDRNFDACVELLINERKGDDCQWEKDVDNWVFCINCSPKISFNF